MGTQNQHLRVCLSGLIVGAIATFTFEAVAQDSDAFRGVGAGQRQCGLFAVGTICDPHCMAELFDYVEHPHLLARQSQGPPTIAAAIEALHGPGPISRFNAKFGLRITVVIGTMWTAYLFTLLALVSAPSAFQSGDKIVIVAWVAQTFLQLVLLPIIIVGQNVQAAAADARSKATYDDACAILEEAKQIQQHLLAQDEAFSRIIDHLGIPARVPAPTQPAVG